MKNFACIILLIACCLSACKEKTVNSETVTNADLGHNDTLSVNTKQIKQTDRIFDDFKMILFEEAAKFSVDFDASSTEEINRNYFLLNDSSLVSSKRLVFTDKNVPKRKFSATVYTFKDIKSAIDVIGNLCEDTRSETLKGESPMKIVLRAFRLDSLVFEVDNFPSDIEHIIRPSFERLTEKYRIHKNDVIPCEREFISGGLAKKIKPAMSKWLEHYKVDINYFYDAGYTHDKMTFPLFNEPFAAKDTLSIYHRPYDKEQDDVYEPMLYDYSPDRNYYLNVRETSGVFKHEDGNWYYMGGDDCQEIYLTNRRSQQKGMVLWLGASQFAEAAFWVDNNMYVIAGVELSTPMRLFIWIGGRYYILEKDEIRLHEYYFSRDIKSRGVITEEPIDDDI